MTIWVRGITAASTLDRIQPPAPALVAQLEECRLGKSEVPSSTLGGGPSIRGGTADALGNSPNVWYNRRVMRYAKRKHPESCQCPWCNQALHAKTRTYRRLLTLKELLVKGATHKVHNQKVKRRLIEAGKMEDACAGCGLGPEWQGEPLTLQLDHKNGDRRDFRLRNLQILCPNCHFQTPTWGNKQRVS